MAPACAPVVNGCEFNPRLRIPSVHIDNAAAAAEAMDHLYASVTAASASSPDRWSARSAAIGCAARQRARGQREEPSRISSSCTATSRSSPGRSRPSGCSRGHERPTAIFCFNDEMAFGVLEVARRHGIRVPEDLSVVGFDDIRFSRHMDPPLTTIAQPMREIGEGTVRLLLDILSGKTIVPTSVTLPHRLIVRGSTARVLNHQSLITDPESLILESSNP